eukprot:CFRG6173T1
MMESTDNTTEATRKTNSCSSSMSELQIKSDDPRRFETGSDKIMSMPGNLPHNSSNVSISSILSDSPSRAAASMTSFPGHRHGKISVAGTSNGDGEEIVPSSFRSDSDLAVMQSFAPPVLAVNSGSLSSAPMSSSPFGSSSSEGEFCAIAQTRSIYVIYTGGTLGMTYGPDGSLRPEPHYLTEKIQSLPEFRSHQMPNIVVHEWDIIKDSSDISWEEAAMLAEEIKENYAKYDGFVILHGTDTMAYTASVLSFMLENLGKPVIVTGSSIPLCEIYNDARRNVIVSFMYASSSDLCEVCVFFNDVLLRGNRCSKVSVRELNAFWSTNFPPLGELGVHMTLSKELLREPPKGHFKVSTAYNDNILQFNLMPGMKPELLRNMVQPPVQGIIMHAFGAGNGPTNPELWDVLAEATARGVYIYVLTQCQRGYVAFGEYAAGQGVQGCGAISGYDITVESAFAKLGVLLGKNLSKKETRRLLESDLRGEMTVDISSDHVPFD